MSNNQPQNQQQSQKPEPPQPKIPGPDDLLRVKVLTGKLLLQHGSAEDNDDIFAQAGEIVEVKRKYFEKHKASRQFDSYVGPNNSTEVAPKFVNDMTLELVEDPIETYNKSIGKAAA